MLADLNICLTVEESLESNLLKLQTCDVNDMRQKWSWREIFTN